MIGGYLKQAMSHPVIGGGAGFLIGWHALSGSLFGGLLMAGTIGTYLQARKMQRGKAAASAAAIAAAVQCGDPTSPECVAEAKSAAIKAGLAATDSRSMPVWAAIMVAVLAGIIVAILVNAQ